MGLVGKHKGGRPHGGGGGGGKGKPSFPGKSHKQKGKQRYMCRISARVTRTVSRGSLQYQLTTRQGISFTLKLRKLKADWCIAFLGLLFVQRGHFIGFQNYQK